MRSLKRIISLLMAVFMLGTSYIINVCAVAYETVKINDDEVRVIFSENLKEINVSDTVIINTETGDEVSISTPFAIGNELVIPLNEVLDTSVEYCIVLSENLKQDNPFVYFVTAMDKTKTQKVTIINDTFDDYTDNGTKINVPENWYARKQGNFNEHAFYSDAEHDKAVRSGMNGYVKTVFSRNFEKVIDYKFSMEFDYNQLAMNKYIQGEEDPNLIQAVFDSVKQSVASFNNIENLNKNMGLSLAPVFEDGQVRKDSNGNELGASSFLPDADERYVSNERLVAPARFFQLYGDRLGFGNWELPTEGNYVKIEKNKWYHVKIDIDMENLEAVAYIDGVQIGPYALPATYRDAQYGAVAARATFYMENPVIFPLKGGSTTYVDSETGETKKYTTKHDSQFVIDNFRIINEEPEFKPIKTRLISMDGKEFAPIQEVNAVINKMTIAFTSGIKPETVNAETVMVFDEEGNLYPCELTGYDEKKYIAELTFEELLPVNKNYTVSVNGVESDAGDVKEGYQTFFSLGDKGGLYIGEIRTLNSFQMEITGSATRGTVAFFDGYMAEVAGQERKLNLVVAAYKSDENGERMIGQAAREIALQSQEKTVSVTNDRLYIMLAEDADLVNAFVYETDIYEPNDGNVEAKVKQNSIVIEGKAAPDESVIVDIPVNKEQYDADKNCTMVYRKVINADENGVYNLALSAEKMASGRYPVFVYATEGKTVDMCEFIYSVEGDINSTAAMLNEADDKATMLGEQYTKLGIDVGLYDEDYNGQVAEILEKYGDLPEDDAETVKDIMNEIYLIVAVDKGDVENLFDYAHIMNLNETEISDWLDKDYVTESFEKAVTTSLNSKKFKSIEGFYDEVTEEFILNVVALKDGYGVAGEIISAFDEEIDVDADKLSDSAYRKTAGKKYESFEALKKALNANNVSKPMGGGSSSGGGGGGSSFSNVSLPAEKKQEAASALSYDIFDDIEDVIWAKPAIVYLAEQGVINGTSENTFSPNNLITREEMAKILVNVYLSDIAITDVPFEDAEKTAWYYPYIAKAYAGGVIKGYNETTFGIGDYITRQDLAVMVYNASLAAGEVYAASNGAKFEDDEKIADYAKKAVYALKGVNAINGIDGVNFVPEGNATRAEAAKIIYSLLKL